jgi:hypothetical protein
MRKRTTEGMTEVMTGTTFGWLSLIVLACALLPISAGIRAQEGPVKVKGGHVLGETAEQFFAEGHEKEALNECAAKDFKRLSKSNKRLGKQLCAQLEDTRQQAISGQRCDYQSAGDPDEMRIDTFTFENGHLVKVELVYALPSAEYNYRGLTFDKIFAGMKEAYGPPTSETATPAKSVYGADYVAHRDLWLSPHSVILINEKPGPGGSTTLNAFTREEYDRTMKAGEPQPANPLQ